MKPRRDTPLVSAPTSNVPPANSLAAPGTGPVRARSSALVQYVGDDDDARGPAGVPASTTRSDRRFSRSLARASWLSSQLMASSMAGRAARARMNVVLGRLLRPELERISRRLPVHVRDFFDRADVRVGPAVTLEAPAHGQGRRLLDGGHLVDPPVAADAPDALVHVNRVIEVDELGQLVDPVPLDRLVLEEALPDLLEHRALVPDLRVAVHAELRLRHARCGRAIDRVVAVAAVDVVVADVMAVIELDRLFDRILHAARERRARIQHQAQRHARGPGGDDKKRDLRQGVVSGAEERTHPRRAAFRSNCRATSREGFGFYRALFATAGGSETLIDIRATNSSREARTTALPVRTRP